MNNIWSNSRGRGSRYRDLDLDPEGREPYDNNNRGGGSYYSSGRGGRGGSGQSFGSYNREGYHSGAMRNYGKKRSFKKSYCGRGVHNHRGQLRGSDPGPRSHIDDDDDRMTSGNQPGTSQGPRRRYSPYASGRGNRSRRPLAMDRASDEVIRRLGVPIGENRGNSQRGTRQGGRPHLPQLSGGPTAWFRVTCPHGHRYDKNYILGLLTNASSHPFVPKEYSVQERQSTFLVQSQDSAQALRSISGTLTTDKGFPLYVNVKPSAPPTTYNFTPEVLERVKIAMSARYDPSTKSLNLSSLASDEALVQNDVFISFYKQSVVRELLKIVNENIPELESLDLTKNDLVSLSSFAELHQKAPNLIRLNLGENKLNNITELDHLRGTSLVELSLDTNPMCDKFSDEDTYVSAIRKRLPKVMRLDGHDLPAPITFDVDTDVSLPPSQGSYFGANEQVKNLVCQFIQQYYGIYDSSDRSGLLDAYHDGATFSLTSYTNDAISGWQPKLSDYHTGNRNLQREKNPEFKQKKLVKGRINIIQQLRLLPSTEHDLNAFTVDIIHLSISMLTFSIQGVFKEMLSSDISKPYIRTFSRVFITVPRGHGISILNEELTITNATQRQIKSAFKSPEPATSQSATAVTPAAATLTPEQKAQMVQQFSVQSGMNADWSTKCLQENKFDYELSAKMFTELQAKGSIPPEAFVK